MRKLNPNNKKRMTVILVSLIFVAGISRCSNPGNDLQFPKSNTTIHPSSLFSNGNHLETQDVLDNHTSELHYGSMTILPNEVVTAQTVKPQVDLKSLVDSYRVEFTNHSGNESDFAVDDHVPGDTISSIVSGEWNINVFGEDSENNDIARGIPDSGNPITINTGGNTAVTVTLGPIDGSGNGTFVYTVHFPSAEVHDADITIDPLPIGGADVFTPTGGSDYNNDFASTGTLSINTTLPSREYFVSIVFSTMVDGSPVNRPPISEIVQIYDNLTSSKEITLTTEDFTQPPAAPTDLTATPSSSTDIQLSWTDASNTESGFEIEYAVDGGAFSLLTEPTAGQTSYDTTITAGNEYEYQIRSLNAFGSSSWSSTVLVPAAPTDLAAEEGFERVELSWSDASSGNSAYVLQRSQTSGSGFSDIASLGADDTSYYDSTANENTTYYYLLRSESGTSGASLTAEVSGVRQSPNPPDVSGDESPSGPTPEWTWDTGGGGNLNFRYKLDDDDLTSGATETTDISYIPSSDLPGGNRILYVQERDDAGNWSDSGSFSIQVVQLVHISSHDPGGYAYNVWGDGTYLYLAGGSGGLKSYSVDGSGNLTLIDTVTSGDEALDVWGGQSGTYLYLADGGSGLKSYSVDGSGNFTWRDTLTSGLSPDANGVWGTSSSAYLANGANGLEYYSIDISGDLTNEGSVFTGNHADGVWGDGTYLYLADGSGGLKSYSVDGPTGAFTLLDSDDPEGWAQGVWGDGTYLYLANGDSGLHVYEVVD